MSAITVKIRVNDELAMRDAYCSTLLKIAAKDHRLVALDADLSKSMGMTSFAEAYPERFINAGIQEANMAGVAAGLSVTGKIPFAHSFAPFASRRCFDQVFLSCCYAKLNVRIIGSDPGITAAFNGGTHMPFEDMGIMRNIPDITILEPVDSVMLENLLEQTMDLYGVFYIRLLRKNAVKIFEKGSTFEIGKGVQIKDGKDATVIASGIMVDEALKAAEKLEAQGISTRVVNIFTLKPIDKEIIIKCARETGAIVTAENHSIINGLGSAVSEVLAENIPVPLERVGVKDLFGEVGPVDYLKERFEMTSEDIIHKIKKVIKRKI